MKRPCDSCICNTCNNQTVCEKSCKLCETITGAVSFCTNECRCEQLELEDIEWTK